MSSPPERYRIKCQAASHPGAAFSFAALAFPACPHRTTHPHRAVTPVPSDVTPPFSSDTTSLSEDPPNLLWYTGTLRVEIADSGNSPCEIAVSGPKTTIWHGEFRITAISTRVLAHGGGSLTQGLEWCRLRSRGLSGLRRVAEEHACWPTCVGYECGARPDITRVQWLYAHISELPDDSSRIVKIPVVHAHHADRILRHALLAFPFLIHYFANFPA